MADFFQEIRKRRVLPAVGFYAGSCWVLVEILDRLVERYLLSPYLTDIAFWGLYSLLPAVILVAWTHGKPGKDETTTAEKVGVPVNIIATIGLLITAFGGKDLGATANLVTVHNEDGVQESHYIPNDSYRRRMAVFFFENESGDAELDWLQFGVTELLMQDLRQSPFMSVTSPWSNFGNGFYVRMKQAGFEDGVGIPRSLMREISVDANRQFFIEGTIKRSAGEFQLTARLWDTRTVEQLGLFTESGWDLYSTVDALSLAIREMLEIPQGRGRIAQDLPLVDTYGESQQALRDYIAALNARLFENDIDGSNEYLDSVIEADPGFVRAWFLKAVNLLDSGDLPSSQEAIQKAQELDYRLPALDRARVKEINYRLAGQTDKLISFLKMQVRLRDDAVSHSKLATMLMATGELEQAKQEFLASLERDALNLDIYLHLAALEKGTGNMDAAIAYAGEYLAEKPEDEEAQVTMGDLLRDQGDLVAAKQHYLEASMLGSRPVVPTIKLAYIAMIKGDENEARSLIEQADGFADSPQDHAQVRAAAVNLETRLGRLNAAIEQLYRQEEYLQQSVSPFEIAIAIYTPMVRFYAYLGDTESAWEALDKARAVLQPPLDQFLAFSESTILLEEGDLDGASDAVEEGTAIIDQFKLEDLRFQAYLLTGFIDHLRGDLASSVSAFMSARDRLEQSVLEGGDISLLLPTINAFLARSQVLNGDLDEAQLTLDRGFAQDPSEPLLWVSKARHQLASDLPQLALASVNYALAIWKSADPEYKEYAEARKLESEIRGTLQGL